MARDGRGKFHKGIDEQEEMTVVILRFKGGGETLRRGFDTVTDALSALGPPTSRRALPHQQKSAADQIDESDLEEEESPEDSESIAEGSADTPRPRRKPKFLSEFNLTPDGQMPWKEYAAGKSPKTVDDKYLVAAGWVTNHGGKGVFAIGHIFTCFRAMKWEEQADFSQPLRRLKATDSYFEVPKRGEWKLTSLGIDAVDKLPGSGPE